MSIVGVNFKGGPFDGENDVKDEAGFSWVCVPFDGKYAFYVRHRDGEHYRFYGLKESFEAGLEHVRSSHRLLQKAHDLGIIKGERP